MPVHQIITTLEEQMQIDDEDPAGDHEEHDDEGQGAGDFSGVKVALMEGDYGANCSIGDLVPWSVTNNNQSLQSDPRYLRPLRHLIRVMRSHDLTNKH